MSPARVLGWLQRLPTNASRLVLLASELDGFLQLDEWTDFTRAQTEVAQHACEAAQNYADEAESDCRFKLVALDSNQVELSVCPMRCKAKGKGWSAPNDLAGLFKVGATHTEAMARLHVGGMQTALRALESTNVHLREENRELREENAHLRALVKNLQAGLDAAAAAEQAEADALTGQAVEVIKEHVLPPLMNAIAEKVANKTVGAAPHPEAAA